MCPFLALIKVLLELVEDAFCERLTETPTFRRGVSPEINPSLIFGNRPIPFRFQGSAIRVLRSCDLADLFFLSGTTFGANCFQ